MDTGSSGKVWAACYVTACFMVHMEGTIKCVHFAQVSLLALGIGENRMKKGLLVLVFTAILYGLCSCGSQQSFYRTEEGLYSYDSRLYQNNGEIALSEKELEYAELIEEFPEGAEGAEWYTELYQYADWLLLGLDDSRSLPGLEGYRYFLLVPAADRIIWECQTPAGDGTPSAICYNGALYVHESNGISEDMLNNMKMAGMIQSVNEMWPGEEFQTNSPGLLGHLLFEYDGKLLISGDGETYGVYAVKEGGR